MEAGWRRTYVLHYRIDAGGVTRIVFVQKWIQQPWAEMESRPESGLKQWHDLVHRDLFFGQYEFAQPCRELQSFTQVAVHVSTMGGHDLSEPRTVYFVVKDKGGYSYEMSHISYDRQDGCPGDTQVDLTKQPSLFEKE
jgi:hypothetical protein